MQPQSGTSSIVNASIGTTDIGACVGYVESTCGAILKEKRIESTGWICMGMVGPAEHKSCHANNSYGYLSPGCDPLPNCHLSSSVPIERGNLGFENYCTPECNKAPGAAGLPDVRCTVVNSICRAEFDSDPTSVCISEEFVYEMPASEYDCVEDVATSTELYPVVTNSTWLHTELEPEILNFFSTSVNLSFAVPNFDVRQVDLDCWLDINCPSNMNYPGNSNIVNHIDNISMMQYCGFSLPQKDHVFPAPLRSGVNSPGKSYCDYSMLSAPNIKTPDCSISADQLSNSSDNLNKIGNTELDITGMVWAYEQCGSYSGVNNCSFTLHCIPAATHGTSWRCDKGGDVYRFSDCKGLNTFSTFQGGNMSVLGNISYSKLSALISSFYNGSDQRTQIPFFMVGQGPTFEDFDKARARCTPLRENTFNISLGNTTFDPPLLTVPERTDVCFENIDVKDHTVNIDEVSGAAFPRVVSVASREKKCITPANGTYFFTDSLDGTIGERGKLGVVIGNEEAVFFVGDRIVPDYGLATEGKDVIFNLSSSDVPLHSIVVSPEESGCTVSGAVSSCSISGLDLGEHGIRDKSTNTSSKVFVQSQTNRFIFRKNSIEPDARDKNSADIDKKLSFIARPFGDSVCFSADQQLSGTCGALVKDWEDDDGTFCSTQYISACYDNVSYRDFVPTCNANPTCHPVSSNSINETQPNFDKYCVNQTVGKKKECVKATGLPDVRCDLVKDVCVASIAANWKEVCFATSRLNGCAAKDPPYKHVIDCQAGPGGLGCQFKVADPQSNKLCDNSCSPKIPKIECRKNLYISVYRERDDGIWALIDKDKEVWIDTGHNEKCCLDSPIPGYYKASTNDGREVRFVISSQKPTATILVRGLGFVPPSTTVEPGTQICWQNPSVQARYISFLGHPDILVSGFDSACTEKMDNFGTFTARFYPDLGASAQVEVSDLRTYSINVLRYGFDPSYAAVKPGDTICWKNTDTRNHILKDERGYDHFLSANDTYCVEHTEDVTYYSMTDNSTTLTSIATSYAGDGIFITPFGTYPPYLIVEKSNESYIRQVAFINKLSKQAEFGATASVIAAAKDVQPKSITAMAQVNVTFANYDFAPHSIKAYDYLGRLITSREVPAASSNESIMFTSSGMIVDGTAATRIGNDNATIRITITPSSLTTAAAGQTVSWSVPNSTGNFRVSEKATGKTMIITVAEPVPGARTAPIFNETMDLPVQEVSGSITSEQLAKMRDYAYRGLVPAVIPAFGDRVVKLKTKAFDPEQLNVSAGSSVVWENTDNAPHELNFTGSHFTSICALRDPETGSLFSCKHDEVKRICITTLINPEQECIKYEPRSSVKCVTNASMAGGVGCRVSLTPEADCEFSITNSGNAGVWSLAGEWCTYDLDTISCSAKPGIDTGRVECAVDIASPSSCTLRTNDYIIWSAAGGRPFCERTAGMECDLSPVYKESFAGSAMCNYIPATDTCSLSKTDFEDLNEAFCMKDLIYDAPQNIIVPLPAKEKYIMENMTRDTIWNITDTKSGLNSSVWVQGWDSDILALFRPLEPDLAEVSSDSYVQISNYKAVLVTLTGKYDSIDISLTASQFGSQRADAPGSVVWIPQGRFAYLRDDGSLSSIYVKSPFEPTVFNLTLSSTGFSATTPAYSGKVSTIAMYPNSSQICVKSADNRHVRVLQEGNVVEEGDTFGVLPDASSVCSPIFACQDKWDGINCSGDVVLSDTDYTNDYCKYTMSKADIPGLGNACVSEPGRMDCIEKSAYQNEIVCGIDANDNCVFMPRLDSTKTSPELNHGACRGDQCVGPYCTGAWCASRTTGINCYPNPLAGGSNPLTGPLARCSFIPKNAGSACSGVNCVPCNDACAAGSASGIVHSTMYSDVECTRLGSSCYVGPYTGSGYSCPSGSRPASGIYMDKYCTVDQHSLTFAPGCGSPSPGSAAWGCNPYCTYTTPVICFRFNTTTDAGDHNWLVGCDRGPSTSCGSWVSLCTNGGNNVFGVSGTFCGNTATGAYTCKRSNAAVQPDPLWPYNSDSNCGSGYNYQNKYSAGWDSCSVEARFCRLNATGDCGVNTLQGRGDTYISGYNSLTCTARTSGVTCNKVSYGSNPSYSYGCSYSANAGASPKACTSLNSCPCMVCSPKYPGAGGQNYACSIDTASDKCKLSISGLTQDPGGANPIFCEKKIGTRCSKNLNFNGPGCISNLDRTGCTTTPETVFDTTGNKCNKVSTSVCVSSNKNIACNDTDKNGECEIVSAPSGYCWAPQKSGQYVIEDVSSGQKAYVTVYGRREPLMVSVQRSALVPAVATTSPGSKVCFASGDGKTHRIALPAALGSLNNIMELTDQYNCTSFPEGRWSLSMVDAGIQGIPASTTIASTTTNTTVDVKYTVFDPETAIMRLGHKLTFTNIDTRNHTVCLVESQRSEILFKSENGVVPVEPGFTSSESEFKEGGAYTITEYTPGKCGGNGKMCINDTECKGTACTGGVCDAPAAACNDSRCKTCEDVSATAPWSKDDSPDPSFRFCNEVGVPVCDTNSSYGEFSPACSLSGDVCVGYVYPIKSVCLAGTYNTNTGKCDIFGTITKGCTTVTTSLTRTDRNKANVDSFNDPGNPACSGTLEACSTTCTATTSRCVGTLFPGNICIGYWEYSKTCIKSCRCRPSECTSSCNMQCGQASSNIGLLKSYTLSPSPSGIYPDDGNIYQKFECRTSRSYGGPCCCTVTVPSGWSCGGTSCDSTNWFSTSTHCWRDCWQVRPPQLANGALREQIFSGVEASVGWQRINPITTTIDLGSVTRVNKVRMYFGGGNVGGINMPQQIDVSISTDGSSYSTVAYKTGMSNAEQWVDISIPSSSARYVKLQVRNSLEWTMIGEVEVYSDPCGAGTCTYTGVTNSVTPEGKSVVDRYCTNDCKVNSGLKGISCSKAASSSVGCVATVDPVSDVCVSTVPRFNITECVPKQPGTLKCKLATDGKGCEYVHGSCGGDGSKCINDANCSSSVCGLDGTCGSIGPTCADSGCATCQGAKAIPLNLVGMCKEYGTTARNYTITFDLPEYAVGMSISYRFNDNGLIFVNGNQLLQHFSKACDAGTDSYTSGITVNVPSGYLKLGQQNRIDFVDCICGGSYGVDTRVSVESVPAAGCPSPGDAEEVSLCDDNRYWDRIVPGGSSTLTLEDTSSCVFIDDEFRKGFKMEVKDCNESDVADIANVIGSYERSDYMTSACDAGLMPQCEKYNPYGPGTVAVITSEKGLDLSNEYARSCAASQVATIKSLCPRCTSALYAGDITLKDLGDILENPNANKSDIIAYSMFFNEYTGKVCEEGCESDSNKKKPKCTNSSGHTDPECIASVSIDRKACEDKCGSCTIDNIIKERTALAKLALYNFSKPSIILEMGAKEGSGQGLGCSWTNDSITAAYKDFYQTWIPVMVGSGIIGAAQYCYEDPCPSLDYYGLFDASGAEKDYTSTWFRDGCGKYYYEAQGLTPLTFSTYETNYSMCDPSRLLTLIQETKCLEGLTIK